MNIFKFSVGSEAKRVVVRCVFAIGVVCWANYTKLFFTPYTAVHHQFNHHLGNEFYVILNQLPINLGIKCYQFSAIF